MGKLVRNGFAVLRGALSIVGWKLFCRKRVSCKGAVRVFSGASLRFYKGGRVHLGKRIKIDKDAVLSVAKNASLSIGDGVGIGANNMVVCHDKISIGTNTILAPNVLIYDHDHVFDAEHGVRRKEYKTAEVTIGKNCWIGANTVILRGTCIGDNCVVGAGCVLKGMYKEGTVIVQKRETVCKEAKK